MTMTKVKTAELVGAQLDWAVAFVEFRERNPGSFDRDFIIFSGHIAGWRHPYDGVRPFRPSTDWATGGPIIELGRININRCHTCYATCAEGYAEGDTPLIAAMRAYVASKLGDVVEVPEVEP